jgi:hypothetical protein
LIAISLRALFYLWQIASIAVLSNERTATAFRISTAIALFAFFAFTVFDDVGGVTAWTENRF